MRRMGERIRSEKQRAFRRVKRAYRRVKYQVGMR
jgi:hypothetical protein